MIFQIDQTILFPCDHVVINVHYNAVTAFYKHRDYNAVTAFYKHRDYNACIIIPFFDVIDLYQGQLRYKDGN